MSVISSSGRGAVSRRGRPRHSCSGACRRAPAFVSLLFGVLLSCPATHAATTTGTVLWYLEQEAGIDPYRVRYIVTDKFMRSDEGDDQGGFVLFDRDERQIYNVVPQNRTVLHIDGKGEAPQPPQDLPIEIRQSAEPEAPSVAGKAPLRMELLANDELCYSAVIVPDLLHQVRSALQEFSQALAVQQLRTLAATPAEYQTACFLSRYVYATDFHMRRGIPIAVWDDAGQRRQLLDYRTGVELDSRLFEVPEDFVIIPTPDL